MVKKTYLRNKRFIFRVTDDQFDNFEKSCKLLKTIPSEMFRKFIDDVIEEVLYDKTE